jgi:hypothetical protein
MSYAIIATISSQSQMMPRCCSPHHNLPYNQLKQILQEHDYLPAHKPKNIYYQHTTPWVILSIVADTLHTSSFGYAAVGDPCLRLCARDIICNVNSKWYLMMDDADAPTKTVGDRDENGNAKMV